MFGSTSPAIASRFMSEIPDELVRDSGLSYLKRPDPARLPGDNYRGSSSYGRGGSRGGGSWDDETWDEGSGRGIPPRREHSHAEKEPYRLGASYGSGSNDQNSNNQSSNDRKKPRTATAGGAKRRLPKMAEERLKGQ